MQWGVKADKAGKWKFKITAPKASGPYEMTLKGKNAITIKNILCGEVWVCSGQSNMEWPVAFSNNAEQEIVASKNEYGIASRLLTKGADVNAKNNQSETPMYLATKNSILAKLLRKHGGTKKAASQ